MKRYFGALLALLVAGLVSAATADDVNGKWKWSMQGGKQARDVTIELKLDGDKLTGNILGRNDQKTAIEDGKFKDGEVSFKVTRERNGMKTVTKYTGKVSGDTIKGKISVERDGGEPRTNDWEAKRVKE
jgi:hypothetical protein